MINLIRSVWVVMTTVLLVCPLDLSADTDLGYIEKNVIYTNGGIDLGGTLCKPAGAGPWPAVIYNHGGLGHIIGGAPEETCQALAMAGFIGFSPIRRPTRLLFGHLDDVLAALNYIKSQSFVDGSRIAMMGFSRGGMLTYQAAIIRTELKAVVIMAIAVNRIVDLSVAGAVAAPVLLLVAQNDTGSRRTRGRNTLQGMKDLNLALNLAGKKPRFIIYPEYGSDGHRLFFSVNRYWKDIIIFLRSHL